MATTMFVKHNVKNFENWKRVYDEFASVRKEKGVIGASVHRLNDDENEVFITHQFKDSDTAMAFADSEELKSAMMKAGVNGKPQIWFTKDVEQTSF